MIFCCARCDFHFLSHLDDVRALSEKTAQLTEQSRRYIETRANESAQLHPSRRELIHQITATKSLKLLDIGAGLGQFQLLLNELGFETEGIEPSRLRRQYAQEKYSLQLSGELAESPYWQENYADYFDIITLWDVIEHVNFPRETLESAVKLLKPGGLILLDTPAREVLAYQISQTFFRFSRGNFSLFLPSFYSSAPFGHKQIFTHAQLTGLFQDLGLTTVYSAQSYGNNPHRGNKIILAGQKER
jgi:2-polyprenyl-6-hydroxyphenyl methylase/3-demethylubiquinone-9 3-methyltransferase